MRDEVDFCSLHSQQIVLITGSYGKTNCMALIRQILIRSGFSVSCSKNNTELQEMSDRTDFILICASFSELKQVRFVPDIVVITNISSYPLRDYRRYGDLLEDLHDFLKKLGPDTYLVENYEYRFLWSIFRDVYAFVTRSLFRLNGTLEEGVWFSPEQVIMMSVGAESVPIIRLEDLVLQGERNVSTYLAAIAAVGRFATQAVLRNVCGTFSGHPEHFCCYQLERNIRLYMQLNTGLPSLAEAAFVGFSEKLVIVTGNFKEVSEDPCYQGFAQMLSAYAKRLILFGPDADLIEYAVRKIGVKKAYDLPIIKKDTANAAIRYAAANAYAGELLLFTPIDYVSGISFDRKRCIFLFPDEEM